MRFTSFEVKRIFLSISGENKLERQGSTVKQEEKKPTNWEVTDPKPPIVQSGHLENRKQY